MKITAPLELKPLEIIRRSGYGLVNDRSSEVSFSRRLGRDFYPRFHAYLNGQTINLHLDQKQASYQGYAKHSGEYEGEAVENEAVRIKEIITKLLKEKNGVPADNYLEPIKKKRSFLSRWF